MFHVARDDDPGGSVGFSQKISSFTKQLNLKKRYGIASEVQDIRKTLQKLRDRSGEYQFISSMQGASSSNARNLVLHTPRLSSLIIEEAELVGIESSRHELISLLTSGTSQRKVILVAGLGGVGKATVARKVYENHNVKGHFGLHAWITVSQSYDKKQLLISILKQFHEEKKGDLPDQNSIAMMDAQSLISELKEYLQKHATSYFIVFDDVWNIGFWGDLEHVLVDSGNGSRILITTGNEGVAGFCSSSSLVEVYKMKLLTEKEAWELFCRKAFKFESEGKCPKALETLSHAFIRWCDGLPLAVVAIGGLLAEKEKTVQEWKKVLDSLSSTVSEDPHLESVPKILSLSYSNLPYKLKSCFLFFGLFPEDFSIKRSSLIQLWIAAGFIQEKEGMRLEEVAYEYLIELISRNLVQVDKLSAKGIPKTCRVHDMVREVILSKSEELSFCHVFTNHSTLEGIARHLFISDGGSKNPKDSTNSQTRSMVFNSTKLLQARLEPMFPKCKLLTILDFDNYGIWGKSIYGDIPKKLGCLVYLRYLNLKDSLISVLPKSIGKLHNLEALDLRGTCVVELPVEIDRFPKLRHLLGSGGFQTRGLMIRGSIGHLQFLDTLVNIRGDNGRLLSELGMLKQLRKLGIIGLQRENGRDLCISLEKMTNLQSLSVNSLITGHRVVFDKHYGPLKVQSMSSPPPHLQTVKLQGALEKLPNWIFELPSLCKLVVMNSGLKDDPKVVLQALPNLNYLCFDGFKVGKMYTEKRRRRNCILKEEGFRNSTGYVLDANSIEDREKLF